MAVLENAVTRPIAYCIGLENIGAVAVDLTSEDLQELDTAASRIALQGARYPEELQKLVGR